MGSELYVPPMPPLQLARVCSLIIPLRSLTAPPMLTPPLLAEDVEPSHHRSLQLPCAHCSVHVLDLSCSSEPARSKSFEFKFKHSNAA